MAAQLPLLGMFKSLTRNCFSHKEKTVKNTFINQKSFNKRAASLAK